MNGWEVPPKSRADLRYIARSIRRVFGIEAAAPFPVMKVLERGMPELYDDFVLEVCPLSEMGTKHGDTIPSKHIIKIREDVYDGAVDGKGRDRLTVTHEMAHLILLEKVAMSFARRPKSSVGLPAYRDSEWQADALAGELLMPLPGVRFLAIPEIIDTYGVSEKAAITQTRAYRKDGLMK